MKIEKNKIKIKQLASLLYFIEVDFKFLQDIHLALYKNRHFYLYFIVQMNNKQSLYNLSFNYQSNLNTIILILIPHLYKFYQLSQFFLLLIFYHFLIKIMNSDKGYYTSRHNILNWINNLLDLNIEKISQLGSGAVYCHILDAAYPQRICLSKVKWLAKRQYQFIHNYKILQASLQHLGIEKSIQVQKMIRGKYQDNYQFAHWMMITFQPIIAQNGFYPALKRRNFSKVSLNESFKRKKKSEVPNNNSRQRFKKIKLITKEQHKVKYYFEEKLSQTLQKLQGFKTIKKRKSVRKVNYFSKEVPNNKKIEEILKQYIVKEELFSIPQI